MSSCGVCNGKSCTRSIGIAAMPGVPMSIMWGEKCLWHPDFFRIVPTNIADYLLDKGLNKLDPGVFDKWATWHKERYMSIRDYSQERHTVGQ